MDVYCVPMGLLRAELGIGLSGVGVIGSCEPTDTGVLGNEHRSSVLAQWFRRQMEWEFLALSYGKPVPCQQPTAKGYFLEKRQVGRPWKNAFKFLIFEPLGWKTLNVEMQGWAPQASFGNRSKKGRNVLVYRLAQGPWSR